MLSNTGLYALQALLRLARQQNGARLSAGVMARELGIPGTYLAKVLQRLAREGILDSARGAHGGYRLLADPGQLTVTKAVALFEDLRVPKTCLMGGPCNPVHPCSAHLRRADWNAAALKVLGETTLADLLDDSSMEPEEALPNHDMENPR